MVLIEPATAAVLTTITLDGNMSDWSAVLADPFQTSYDGPAGPLPDLDSPSAASRDLTTFAWTYDPNNFFVYFRRASATSGRQRYLIYFDTNSDGRMQSGEPVALVWWWGGTRIVVATRYAYNAVSGAGDPLGDPSGRADGWTLPGSLGPGTTYLSARSASPDRLQIEWSVPWALLGVPAGTPMQFHVSSARGTNIPSQIDDNMGGPGGLVGNTAPTGVTIAPSSLAATIVASGTVMLPHTLTNAGAATDTINIDWSASGAFSPASLLFFYDADGNGSVGPGDPQLIDTDGDSLPDSGPLPPGGSMPVLVEVTAPAGVVDGDSTTIDLTVSSSSSPTAQDSASDTCTVATPQLTLVKSVSDVTASPGTVLTYTVDWISNGAVTAYNVVLLDPVPAPAVYQTGSTTGPGALVEFSHDGGTSFDVSDAAPVTHVRWTFSTPLGVGSSGQVSYQAVIP